MERWRSWCARLPEEDCAINQGSYYLAVGCGNKPPLQELIALICCKCLIDKPDTDFSFRNKTTGKRHTICKICKRQIDNEYYAQNSIRRAQVASCSADKLQRNKDFVEAYKNSHSCIKCGESRPYVLDFHHITGDDKHEEICVLSHRGCSISTIQKEIEKCVLLCSNCHREFHWLEQNKGITTEQYLER